MTDETREALDGLATIHERENADLRRLVEEAKAEAACMSGTIEELQLERDRLKGELAEVRRDSEDATHAIASYPCDGCEDGNRCTSCKCRAKLGLPSRQRAAPPAEQAQPTVGKGLSIDEWRESVRRQGVAEMNKLRTPVAEQAQGEGAPTCTCGSGAHPRRCETHPWAFGQHVEELSREALADDVAALTKLVTQLQDGCTESGARRATETAALAKRVEAMDKAMRERWGNYDLHPQRPAPPPPEAAVPCDSCGRVGCACNCRLPFPGDCSCKPESSAPGHAFVPGPGLNAGLCWHPTGKTQNDVCGDVERNHAVPPITGGRA